MVPTGTSKKQAGLRDLESCLLHNADRMQRLGLNPMMVAALASSVLRIQVGRETVSAEEPQGIQPS